MEERENDLNENSIDKRLTGDPKKDITIWSEKSRFSKDNQPSSEAKKAGWARKLRNRKLAQMLLNKTFVGRVAVQTKSGQWTLEDTKFRKVLKDFFGLNDEEMKEMSNEAAIMLRMIGQAISEGDVQAGSAILERAYGKPKDMTPFDDPEAEDEEGNKPQIVIQIVQSVDLPPIKEDESDESANV